MSALYRICEEMGMVSEKGPDGGQMSAILFGKKDPSMEIRIVNKKNASKVESAFKAKKIKFEKTTVDLSKSKYKGHVAFGFKNKFEDDADDVLYDDLKIKHANPLSYDDDWNSADIEKA